VGPATCLGMALNLVRCGTSNMFGHGIEPCEVWDLGTSNMFGQGIEPCEVWDQQHVWDIPSQ